jgi:hypothetical protein
MSSGIRFLLLYVDEWCISQKLDFEPLLYLVILSTLVTPYHSHIFFTSAVGGEGMMILGFRNRNDIIFESCRINQNINCTTDSLLVLKNSSVIGLKLLAKHFWEVLARSQEELKSHWKSLVHLACNMEHVLMSPKGT